MLGWDKKPESEVPDDLTEWMILIRRKGRNDSALREKTASTQEAEILSSEHLDCDRSAVNAVPWRAQVSPYLPPPKNKIRVIESAFLPSLQSAINNSSNGNGVVKINNTNMGGDPARGVQKHFGAIVEVDGVDRRFALALSIAPFTTVCSAYPPTIDIAAGTSRAGFRGNVATIIGL